MASRCGGRPSAGRAVAVLLLVCQIICCRGQLASNGTDSAATGCTPREITSNELAVWVNERSNDVSGAEISRRPLQLLRQRRRRRWRRRLLVSDTECSTETLCHPTARPRVCYYNSDMCDGVRDCDTGRDELYCDDCLCPYQTITGVTMNVPDGRVRHWLDMNLQSCARACNDIDAGCVAFSFNALRRDEHRCRIFFMTGPFVASNLGGVLYLRNAPSVPRLAPSTQGQSAPLAPQVVTAENCSSIDMFDCRSQQRCLPYSLLCDGIQQCTGSNEEATCGLFPTIYTRSPGKTLGSYSTPLPPVSLEACAGYCIEHSTTHPKCLFFAYRSSSRECLIGCGSCSDSVAVLDDPDADYYSVSLGGVAGLAAVLVNVGASYGNRKDAASYGSLLPSIRQVTESLKTLGVSVPSEAQSTAVSKLLALVTRTSPPAIATVRPESTRRPVFKGKPPGSNPPSFTVSGNSANRPNSSSFPTQGSAANKPSSSFSSATAASSVPSPTPQLPSAVLPQLPTDCGRRPLDVRAATNTQTRVLLSDGSSNRVVNGQRARYGTYPWQAQIQVYSERGHFEHHCGGALIGERLVLTAAHCLQPALSRLQVKLGQHDRRDAGERYEQTFAVENALTHPGYRSDPARGDADDLAVLKLRLRQGRPVMFSSHVQPLCLPTGPPLPAGHECHISGWGKTDSQLPDSPDSAADVLHGAVVPLVSDTVCSAREVYGERFVPGGMVCAGHLSGGPDACQGDSGGPLACPAADGRWQLTGIVSFGEGCGGLLKPGVYTRVGYYVSWIRRVVQLL